MPHVIVRINFEEYSKWKPVFDEAQSLRKSYGSKEATKRTGVSGPPEVTFLEDAGQLPA